MWRDRIAEIKREKGITTREISERSGVSVDTISRILKREDAEAPRIDTIAIIAEKGLGVSLGDIFAQDSAEIAELKAEVARLKDELIAVQRAYIVALTGQK